MGFLAQPATQPYKLIDSDKTFELAVSVPGMNEDDIDVKLDNGRLTIQGQKVNSTETSRLTSKFYKTFALDPIVDANKLTATLKDGVLAVSAPKDLTKLEENVRTIPITAAVDAPSGTDEDGNTSIAHDNTSQEEGQKEKEPEAKLSYSDSTAEGHKVESED